jgi:hypothetical protein
MLPMPKLNNKEEVIAKVFARAYIANSMNGAKTIKQLYPHKTEKASKVRAHALLKKPEIRNEIVRILDHQGLTKDYLIEKLSEGLGATMVLRDNKSNTLSITSIPNYDLQHRYLTTALKLHGELQDKSNNGNSINIGVVHIPRELKDESNTVVSK